MSGHKKKERKTAKSCQLRSERRQNDSGTETLDEMLNSTDDDANHDKDEPSWSGQKKKQRKATERVILKRDGCKDDGQKEQLKKKNGRNKVKAYMSKKKLPLKFLPENDNEDDEPKLKRGSNKVRTVMGGKGNRNSQLLPQDTHQKSEEELLRKGTKKQGRLVKRAPEKDNQENRSEIENSQLFPQDIYQKAKGIRKKGSKAQKESLRKGTQKQGRLVKSAPKKGKQENRSEIENSQLFPQDIYQKAKGIRKKGSKAQKESLRKGTQKQGRLVKSAPKKGKQENRSEIENSQLFPQDIYEKAQQELLRKGIREKGSLVTRPTKKGEQEKNRRDIPQKAQEQLLRKGLQKSQEVLLTKEKKNLERGKKRVNKVETSKGIKKRQANVIPVETPHMEREKGKVDKVKSRKMLFDNDNLLSPPRTQMIDTPHMEQEQSQVDKVKSRKMLFSNDPLLSTPITQMIGDPDIYFDPDVDLSEDTREAFELDGTTSFTTRINSCPLWMQDL